MMSEDVSPLISYSEQKRAEAMDKYKIIQPYLSGIHSMKWISQERSIPYRTLQWWVQKYTAHGLKGLIRKKRKDMGNLKVDEKVQEEVKHVILSLKRNTISSIHRKVCDICRKNNWEAPSYDQVYAISKNITPGMKKLAHEGRKNIKTTMI